MKRPCVLIFAGSDPSGGAGLQADIQAVAAQGAHPLTVLTALTVQDNDRVYSVHPVPADLVSRQAQALINKGEIAAVKIGITGNMANADAIVEILRALKRKQPDLPVVLDPVQASGHGDALAADGPLQAAMTLLPLATVVLPNLPEAMALCGGERRMDAQVDHLLRGCPNVLIKGGHGSGPEVINSWYAHGSQKTWKWQRFEGSFHGTGCTLASALAALLASGRSMPEALELAQAYSHQTIRKAYAIAAGQRIPDRRGSNKESK
jgi:hydroxymethylpyrimidine/phosphomethylpyrimidine kinase